MSRAAADLGCTQSILSRQLLILEQELGQSLFARTGRGVTLTERGQKLLSKIAPSFATIDQSISTVQSDLMEGTLTLATIHSLSYFFLGPLLREFSRDYPGVKIRLLTRSSMEIAELVETKKADAGLVYDTAVASSELTSIPLFQSEMCLIAPITDALGTTIDLTDVELRLLVFPQNHALRRMLASSKVNFSTAAEVDRFDSMMEMAAVGMGYCILPNRIPAAYLASRGLRKIKIERPTLARQVAYIRRSEDDSMLLKKLELAIEAQAGSVPSSMHWERD